MKQKIYDCFTFFNELELLEIRFKELYDHVDHFVLLEAAETFRGKPKPYHYEQNRLRFAPYADKIIHLKIGGHFDTPSAWEREASHRNGLLEGLKTAAPDDIILISDVDEIVRASILPALIHLLNEPSPHTFKRILCRQTCYRYYLNRLDDKSDPWPGTYAVHYKNLIRFSPETLRHIRMSAPWVIPQAGWHFTSMGGHARFLEKLASFSHAECDIPEWRSYDNLQKRIRAFPLVPIDSTYPAAIAQNQDLYKRIGFLDLSTQL